MIENHFHLKYNPCTCKILILRNISHRNKVIPIRENLQNLPICDNDDRKIAHSRKQANKIWQKTKFLRSAMLRYCDVAILRFAMVATLSQTNHAMARSAMVRFVMLRKQIVKLILRESFGHAIQ